MTSRATLTDFQIHGHCPSCPRADSRGGERRGRKEREGQGERGDRERERGGMQLGYGTFSIPTAQTKQDVYTTNGPLASTKLSS